MESLEEKRQTKSQKELAEPQDVLGTGVSEKWFRNCGNDAPVNEGRNGVEGGC